MRAGRVAAALAAAAAGILLLRRRRAGREEHVALYFADGSSVTLADAAEAEPLLAAAREALAAVRG